MLDIYTIFAFGYHLSTEVLGQLVWCVAHYIDAWSPATQQPEYTLSLFFIERHHHVLLFVLQVLETCSDVVREMEEAGGAGDKGRLQEALKEAVNWLSKNGSNPDVATNSAQVQCSLFCSRTSCLSNAESAIRPEHMQSFLVVKHL